MLNVLRESVKNSPVLKWILMAVGLGLVAYLGNYFISDPSTARSDWVARVNGTEISERSFRQTARNLDQNYRDLFGEQYEQLKPQLGIGQNALNSLITRELVLQDARRMGLQCSPAGIAERIRTHPSLQDPTGEFIGKERYKQVLDRSFPGGVTAFEQGLAAEMLFERWTQLVSQPVVVTDAELQEIFRQRTEKTSIDYVIVTTEDQKIDRTVNDNELKKWYDDNLDDFMRDEGRVIRYIAIDREAQQAKVEIAEAEIQAYYDDQQTTYSHPEQRRARHILFRADPSGTDQDRQELQARAETTLQRIRDGEDFGAVAGELSEDPLSAQNGGDLDFFGRGQMVEAFDAAAFSTPVGQIAPIVETPYGLHIIEVTDSRPAGVTPLDGVADDIRRLLQLRGANEQVAIEAQRLHEAIGSADRLAQVAAEEGLTVESRSLIGNERVPGLGSAEFTAIVASLGPGELSNPLPVASGLAIVVVDEVLPPAPAPFEEVRISVTAELLGERARRSAIKAAESVQGGEPAELAARLGLDVKQSGDLSPGQTPPDVGGPSPELLERLFADEAAEGDRGVVAVPAGAIAYEITRRETFDAERFETERAGLRDETLQVRRENYVQSIISQLIERQQVEINPSWESRISQAG